METADVQVGAQAEKQKVYFAQLAGRAAIDSMFDGGWITLYSHKGDESWFSALIAPERVGDALRGMNWDLHWGRMQPGIVTCYQGDEAEVRYQRFEKEGVEPLVIARERGSGPFFVELTEELRLFLNLFPGDDGCLVGIDDSGNSETVAKVREDEIRVRKGPLLRYLQARQMHLAIFFDHIITLDNSSVNPLPLDQQELLVSEPDRVWGFASTDIDGQPLSRLFGKRLLAPPPRADPEEARYVEFIITENDVGRPVEHSADPAGLANLFGKNPGAPDYLTQVHFRRDVLDRYFHNPARYEVSDGLVRCDTYWLLRIDDDHRERVVVFLGDLGRDLPYTEQLHWRAHNIPPEGGLSRTAQARSFDAEFSDGKQPEHRFKAAYAQLTDRWIHAHGWPLFRPLTPSDAHLLVKLHVPTSDNPAELDAQLLGLAKILVDALNDAALDAVLAAPVDGERSLAKLERYLVERAYPHVARDIATLRAIQGLRSSGAAHSRGSNYDKALRRIGLDGQSAPTIVTALLIDATTMLESLAETCPET